MVSEWGFSIIDDAAGKAKGLTVIRRVFVGGADGGLIADDELGRRVANVR